MLAKTSDILSGASDGGYAVGAFNVYNMEGALAVAEASESTSMPAIIQLHPGSLNRGGEALIRLCIAAAETTSTPMSVHLDHCDDESYISRSLKMGMNSVMVDGSRLDYLSNVNFTKEITRQIHSVGGLSEAELGRLSGTEDGLTVPEYEEKLTDPVQAKEFVDITEVDSLAVCIGNVHGKYIGEPNLDFERLKFEAEGLTALRRYADKKLLIIPEPLAIKKTHIYIYLQDMCRKRKGETPLYRRLEVEKGETPLAVTY